MYRCHRLALLASLCTAATACGSVKDSAGHLPDAAGPTDDAPVAPVRGAVHVTVLDPAGTGAPAVGANVVFIDPDGTVVKKVLTDTAGKADADVLPGANVTGIELSGSAYRMQTVLAIKPGDDIVIGAKPDPAGDAGSFTISFPAYPNASAYQIVTPCNTTSYPSTATTQTLSFTNACKQDTMEIVVIPMIGSAVQGSISKSDIKFVSGGSTTLTGAYGGLRTLTASYANVNAIVTNLDMTRYVPDNENWGDSASASPPTATTTLTATGPITTSAHMTTSVTNTAGSFQTVRQSVSGNASTYGLDVGATLLPWIGMPSYDATVNKLVIPTDTTGTSTAKPDVFSVTAGYSRLSAVAASTAYTWVFYGPDIADIALPALPDELAVLMPTATDSVRFLSPQALEADTVAGYDAVRNDPVAALKLYGGAGAPAATVRISFGLSKR